MLLSMKVSTTSHERENIKALAERVIELISRGTPVSLEQARRILFSCFPKNPRAALRAYEKAWIVVIKRRREEKDSRALEGSTLPRSDWMAMSASFSARKGLVSEAFSRLRSAVASGARPTVCIQAALDVIQRLPSDQKIQSLVYAQRELIEIKVGNVSGDGLVVVSQRVKRPASLRSREDVGLPVVEVTLLDRAEITRRKLVFRYHGLAREKRKTLQNVDWGFVVGQLVRTA